MWNNNFTQEQYEYMYTDEKFVYFLNTFFSSYNFEKQVLNAKLYEEKDIENIEIYLRIILANLDILKKGLYEVEKNLSYTYEKQIKTFNREIRGNLLINKYVQEIIKHSIPKKYDCSIKIKTYNTPENIYILHIMQTVIYLLEKFASTIREIKFNNDMPTELIELDNQIKEITEFINKPFFKDCMEELYLIRKIYDDKFPDDKLQLIKYRSTTGKIRNLKAYEKVFDWIKLFENTSLSFVDKNTLKTLRYSEKFSNRLFELWCLYRIKYTLINSFNFDLIKENNVMDKNSPYIFLLKSNTGMDLKIYYQKGNELYWNKEKQLFWHYVDGKKRKGLKGIPDISIEYIEEKRSLIMIDVKNKIREKRKNSEEIYKMIGYFSNFKNIFETKNNKSIMKKGVVLFRNDICGFMENLESVEGDRLMNLSVSPIKSEELNKQQFYKLCEYILEK